MTISEICDRFAALDVEVTWHVVRHGAGNFRWPRLASRPLTGPVFMIGAGIHGDEISGPISLALYADDLFRYARGRGVSLIVYPLRNPSGFGLKRYNIDVADAEVVTGNNDFLRYRTKDGRVVDDLKDGKDFASWGWCSDFDVDLPPETRLMHEVLRSEPLSKVAAVLDLHQDLITPGADACAYHYGYGDLSRFRGIVQAIEGIIPIGRHCRIGAGYADHALLSDGDGFIVRHDGTWPDLMYRLGEAAGRSIPCITAETTGATPLDTACEVNRLWMFGLVDLIASKMACVPI